jgi:hypothetical protein
MLLIREKIGRVCFQGIREDKKEALKVTGEEERRNTSKAWYHMLGSLYPGD